MAAARTMKAISLRTKFSIGVGAFFVLYTAGLVSSYASVRTLREFADTTPRLITLVDGVSRYLLLLEHIESDVDDLFVANYPEQRTDLLGHLDELREAEQALDRTADFPRLSELSPPEPRVEQLRERVGLLLDTGFAGTHVNARAVDMYAEINRMREAGERFLGEVRQLAEAISQERNKTFNVLLLELMLVGSVMMLALLCLIVFLTRSFILPLQKITTAAESIRRGEYGRTTGISGGDEIGRLATTLDEASRGLRKKAALERRSRELEAELQARAADLEQRVKEYERVNRLLIGRELRMVELKKELMAARAKKIPKG